VRRPLQVQDLGTVRTLQTNLSFLSGSVVGVGICLWGVSFHSLSIFFQSDTS
jgi:hypothetical protein